jgi:hypothetical protein
MRSRLLISQNKDNVGWALIGTIVGIMNSSNPVWHICLAILTTAIGVILAHFLKRELNYRFPPKKDENKEDRDKTLT